MKKYLLKSLIIISLTVAASCAELFGKKPTTNTTVINNIENKTVEVNNNTEVIDNSETNKQTDNSVNVDIKIKPSVPSIPNPSGAVKSVSKKVGKLF